MTQKTLPVITMKKLEEMTPEAARVLIAKDVLQLLQLESIDPARGRYVSCFFDYDTIHEGTPLQDVLEGWLREGEECQVCALGAALVATVRRFDEVTVEPWMEDGLVANRQPTVKYLERFFSVEQLALIEYAFERIDEIRGMDRGDLSEKDIDAAVEYTDGTQPSERLQMIFVNIVANNGTFTPF